MTEHIFEAAYQLKFLNNKEFNAFKDAIIIGGSLGYYGPEICTFTEENEYFPCFDTVSINELEPTPTKRNLEHVRKDKPFTVNMHYGGIKTEYIVKDGKQTNTDALYEEAQNYVPNLLKTFKEKGICDTSIKKEYFCRLETTNREDDYTLLDEEIAIYENEPDNDDEKEI